MKDKKGETFKERKKNQEIKKETIAKAGTSEVRADTWVEIATHLLCSKVMMGKLFPFISAIARSLYLSLRWRSPPRSLRPSFSEISELSTSPRPSHSRFLGEEEKKTRGSSQWLREHVVRVEAQRRYRRSPRMVRKNGWEGEFLYPRKKLLFLTPVSYRCRPFSTRSCLCRRASEESEENGAA